MSPSAIDGDNGRIYNYDCKEEEKSLFPEIVAVLLPPNAKDGNHGISYNYDCKEEEKLLFSEVVVAPLPPNTKDGNSNNDGTHDYAYNHKEEEKGNENDNHDLIFHPLQISMRRKALWKTQKRQSECTLRVLALMYKRKDSSCKSVDMISDLIKASETA